MRRPRVRPAAVLTAALLALSACDRKVEPFVPGEQPSQPDLRKIFPPGAEPAKPSPGVMGEVAATEPAAAAGSSTPSGAPVGGRVVVAPALVSRMPAGAVLFIIARRGATGPPIAVKRIDAPRFPFDFEIGPDDRMIQTVPFEGPLLLAARLDSDANASTRTAGDLQGTASSPVATGTRGVEIVLDEVL